MKQVFAIVMMTIGLGACSPRYPINHPVVVEQPQPEPYFYNRPVEPQEEHRSPDHLDRPDFREHRKPNQEKHHDKQNPNERQENHPND